MRIGLCGALVVCVDGERREEALSGRQGRLIVAYLALHHRRPVRRDELIDALWGESAPQAPAQGLNVILSKLRRALGPGLLRAIGRECVQLADEVRVDREDAEAFLRSARAAQEAGEWESAQEAAERVIELAERGLLPGLEAPWLEEPRRDLGELGLQARELLGEAALAQGDAAALAAAERAGHALIDAAPYRESGHVLLMRALETQGNVAEALRAHDRLRVLLRDELGVPPSARVHALVERLLHADAVPPTHSEVAAAEPVDDRLPFFATRSRAEFVGRRVELGQLSAHFARTLTGERAFVLLEGEPGIGKTRLALHFAAECRAQGARVLYGRCDAESLVPYQPFVEALRRHAGARDGLGAWAATHGVELARVLPELVDAPRSGHPLPSSEEGATERYRLFEAVSALLVEVARARPVLLVLDDLHWADRPTLLMLRQVVRATEQAPLLILGTYRDTERGDALLDTLADLRRDHVLERVSLTGLEPEEASTLMIALAQRELPGKVSRALWEETKGNPFFLEEVVHPTPESPSPDDGTGGLLSRQPGGVPEGVKEVVGRRLARLSPSANRLLTTAAVIGQDFPLELLEPVVALPEDELDEAIEEAVGAQVIVEMPGVFGRYSFSHALIRQTLYDNLTATRRARLHLRIAQALEALADDDPTQLASLAHHYFRAPPRAGLAKAVDYAERAAERAEGVLAFEEAARLYSLALDGLGSGEGDERRRLRLTLARGEALVKAGEAGAARSAYREAHTTAQRLGAPRELALAALGYGTTRHMTAGFADPVVVGLLEDALAATEGDESGLRARLLARLAVELYHVEQRPARVALSDRAVALARRVGDAGAISYALIARHWALWEPENLDERLAAANDLLSLAARSGDKKIASQGHRWRMIDLLELGDVAAVDAELADYAALVEERRQLADRWYLDLFTAMRHLIAGRLQEAEAASQVALRAGARVGEENAVGGHVLQMVVLRREQGRLGEVEDAVRETGVRFPALPAWRAALAHVHAEIGREEEARAELAALAPDGFRALPRDAAWLGAVAYLAEVAVAVGDTGHASTLYELLLPYAERNVVIGWASACTGSASRHLGLLAAALGRPEDAAEHFEAALAMNARMGATPWVVRTQLAYAELLLARGDVSRARGLLSDARAQAEPLGLTRLLEQLEALEASERFSAAARSAIPVVAEAHRR